MTKRSIKEWIVRCLILLVGLTVAHFGVTLYLLADLGSDPFNVLVQGVSGTLQELTGWAVVSHGNVHIVMCLLIILVLLLTDRSYVKIGTVLCMLCGGPIIDGFTALLSPLFQAPLTLWVAVPVELVACLILACGMTIVIKSDAGTGPNDLVAVVTADKLHRPFGVVRIVVDVLFVAIGWLLGGAVGVGTIICAFLVGPVAGFFLPRNEKLVNWVLKKTGV